MKAYYDLHLHSCLSPCGDNDMTPNNIVNMAKILGLDIIAITDHNSSLNCNACMQAGSSAGIAVVPGMELCTSEEIHIVCLFPTLKDSIAFGKYVKSQSLPVKNRTDIYGNQFIMDSNDNIIGEEENLLILASNISVENVYDTVNDYNGVCYPAHIDRDSYSLLSVLGEFPPNSKFTAAEITSQGNIKTLTDENPILNHIPLIKSSDAHYLENIQEPSAFLELNDCSPQALVAALKDKNTKWGR